MPGHHHPSARAAAHPRSRGLIVALLLLGALLPGLLRPASLRAADWLPAAAPGWETRDPVLLADGRLLVAGGLDRSDQPPFLTRRAALYNPATDEWRAIGDLAGRRALHNTTPLPDGGAIVTGGAESSSSYGTQTAERLDPVTKLWRAAAPMKTGRYSHSATILPSGKVLVVGGLVGGASPSSPARRLASVEVYDPVADSWQDVAPLAAPRGAHRAVLLADGTVLVIGGDAAGQTAERYDPQANRWTPAGTLNRARVGFTATLLHDGPVLVVGGSNEAEVYHPATNAWSLVARPATERMLHTATLLPSGEVLVAGGSTPGGPPGPPTDTTERYDPASNTWRADSPLLNARTMHSAILVYGKVYVLDSVNGAEVYDATTAESRCFSETGRCAHGRFLAYWEAHGGLPINGYPLSEPFAEQLEDGKVYLVQYFERVRMEYHPENSAPNDVLLGQFGRRIHGGADPATLPKPGEHFFIETGHNVPDDFFEYWETNGGLPQFGFPITEVITETLEDGNEYEVQYFERARFERHPENPAPHDILLGQFGRRILAGR
jgi:N-acetylneuraminic acid mutarotase